MSSNDLLVHHTVTSKIQDAAQNGWEFRCPTCGYRARYFAHPRPGAPQLEILHPGNRQARHLSNSTPGNSIPKLGTNVIENEGDESWLTPKLRQQMEDLLKDVNMDDWAASH
jgi:hypothetical protein